jgi:alternate signal-mediated exported protein
MASNSKKRRRVLGASCILAALIIASSSFAWFTSQDEVTNRLSANADYDVSIVESFSPPKNWLPNQEVNKDVYAVNTGSVAAFVKEEVSGVMTYTVEKKTDTLDEDKSVKLTAAERYVTEAGAYLALAPVGSSAEVGNQVISMVPDGTNLDAYVANNTPVTDFTPDAEGLYVFRRSIDVDENAQTEMFKYDGYYYKGGNFYKVKIVSVTPDAEVDLAGDNINTDGNLTAATVKYYEEETNTVVPNLTYDATNNRLVATVDTGSHGASYAELEAAAEAYDEALENYQLALAAFNAATSANNTANGKVASKKAAMDAAYIALQNAIAATQAAADAKAVADAKVADLTAQQSALATQIGNAGSGLTKDKADKLAAKNAADAAVAAYTQTVQEQFAQDVQTKLGIPLANATYEQLNGLFGSGYENYEYYQLVVAQKKAQEEYDAADAALTDATTQKNAVDAALATATTDASNADTNLTAAQGSQSTAQTAFDNAEAEYNSAVTNAGATGTSGNLDAARTALSNAAQTLANAEATYNELSDTLNSATEIKININLSDDVTTAGGVADKWQLKPTDLSATDIAEFYYTGILEGAETSSKLIDSVELDSSVTQDMYKYFDFDLNVALKSAQIAYDTDDETILATAATTEIGATPTLTNPKDINTALTW